MTETYKGYLISVKNNTYKIAVKTEDKIKCIRTKGYYGQPINTHMGKMYRRYTSDQMAMEKAKEYINEFKLPI